MWTSYHVQWLGDDGVQTDGTITLRPDGSVVAVGGQTTHGLAQHGFLLPSERADAPALIPRDRTLTAADGLAFFLALPYRVCGKYVWVTPVDDDQTDDDDDPTAQRAVGSDTTDANGTDGRWVTLNGGVHVFLDKGGSVTRGPAAFVGKPLPTHHQESARPSGKDEPIPEHPPARPAPTTAEESVQERARKLGKNGLPLGSSFVADAARRYVKEAGIADTIPDSAYTHNDVPTQSEIGRLYDQATHDPADPSVKAAYAALAKEVAAQYDVATRPESAGGMAMRFEPWTKEGQPYLDSRAMRTDVAQNHHLAFFLGGDMPDDHPMRQVDPRTGLTVNDEFRAIHDLFGHAAMGFEFGPRGEENAWREHRKMFSAAAQPAMTTETRGQNSWVNYGPLGAANRADPSHTVFADQKAMLLPAWALDPNGKPPNQPATKASQREVPVSNDETTRRHADLVAREKDVRARLATRVHQVPERAAFADDASWQLAKARQRAEIQAMREKADALARHRAALAPAPPPTKGVRASGSDKTDADGTDGRWVTLQDGVHVFLDKGGTVTKGPAAFVGKPLPAHHQASARPAGKKEPIPEHPPAASAAPKAPPAPKGDDTDTADDAEDADEEATPAKVVPEPFADEAKEKNVPYVLRHLASRDHVALERALTQPPLGDKPTPEQIKDAATALAGQRVHQSRRVGVPRALEDKPENLAQLRNDWVAQAKEGAAARDWYERSGKAVLAAFAGDKKQAGTFVQLLAIYSQHASVGANSAMALRAYGQYLAGQPIRSGLGAVDKAASDLLYHGLPWNGRKKNNFYINLMTEIDPKAIPELNHSTIDQWMLRAASYPPEIKAPNKLQYEFLADQVQHVTDRLNAERKPGEAPWSPHQTQAAIWTSTLSRWQNLQAKHPRPVADLIKKGADQDYSYFLAQARGQVSWETAPGTDSGWLPGYATATLPQQEEFHRAIRAVFLDEDGRDIAAHRLGLPSGDTFDAPGVWKGHVSPGSQTSFLAGAQPYATSTPKLDANGQPIIGENGKPVLLKKSIPGAYGKVDPATAKLLDGYAALRGLLLHQSTMAWTWPAPARTKKEANASHLKVGRVLNDAEAAALDAALSADPLTHEHAVVSTADGAWIVHTGGGPIDGAAFQKAVHQAATEVDFAGDPDLRVLGFVADSHLIEGGKDGTGYRDAFSHSGRRDVLDGLATDLAKKVDDVAADFAKRYGWDNARPSGADAATRAWQRGVWTRADGRLIFDILAVPLAPT